MRSSGRLMCRSHGPVGGLKADKVKRMKELENQRLRKAVSDPTLDKLILSEATKKNF